MVSKRASVMVDGGRCSHDGIRDGWLVLGIRLLDRCLF
jgi:hypothetical protein